jgi:DnaK suppressor protein
MATPSASERKELLAMPDSEYMNAKQKDFFFRLITSERARLIEHIDELSQQLKRSEQQGDEADKAIREEELRLLFRQIDRQSRLLPKYDAALIRLHNDEYGFCTETGDPIGLQRLLLRPIAELSIDAKIRQEIIESQYRK